jgi:hypothetical protein
LQRLGRTLCADDFTDAVVNFPDKGGVSDRMRQRLAATESWRLEPLDYPREDPPPPEFEDEGPPKTQARPSFGEQEQAEGRARSSGQLGRHGIRPSRP